MHTTTAPMTKSTATTPATTHTAMIVVFADGPDDSSWARAIGRSAGITSQRKGALLMSTVGIEVFVKLGMSNVEEPSRQNCCESRLESEPLSTDGSSRKVTLALT